MPFLIPLRGHSVRRTDSENTKDRFARLSGHTSHERGNMMQNAFCAADILLPDFNKTDGEKWSVIACDQFTSDPAYWGGVKAQVAGVPSTLNLILPEVYLAEAQVRIPEINRTMYQYLSDGLFREYKNAMIYVERTQSDGDVRRGIVGKIDLEKYDFHKGAETQVRATEATVLDRVPPRVAIRKDAPLELPHIMTLIDDPEKTVIEPLSESAAKYEKVYDYDLMLSGGHIKGYLIPALEQNRILHALDQLASPAAMKQRYGTDSLPVCLFAVGDGNHSLAAAKTVYEELKQKIGAAAKESPARYALVELVNLHDPALRFEPIYRVLFGVRPEQVIRELKKYADSQIGDEPAQTVQYLSECFFGEVVFPHPSQQLTVGTLQTFLDGYAEAHPEISIDYIHGEESVHALASKPDTIGFLFDGMEKTQLFRTVMCDGALPRKTFSMGHAEDKRYYLEARKIR